MRNSREILIDARKILTYKTIILGSGSIMSLTERHDDSDTVAVNESTDQIEALIFEMGCKKVASDRINQNPVSPKKLKHSNVVDSCNRSV